MKLENLLLKSPYPPPTRGTVVVWGYLASQPFGGMTWQALHYIVGLRRLGFDAWYVEDTCSMLCDPQTYWPTYDHEANVRFLDRTMELIGMRNRWVFRPPDGRTPLLGACEEHGLDELYRQAKAVFNICGSHELREEHAKINCLVYVETDPVPNQVAIAQGQTKKIAELDHYHHLFTYGENLGQADCKVPLTRYTWHSTRPPVCLDWWGTTQPPSPDAALTTIANWKHSAPDKDVSWNGETWRWSKHYEFGKFLDLPANASVPLEIALGSVSAEERRDIAAQGWRLIESTTVSDPAQYRRYIQNSLGEFTASKEQYVAPKTGWFSDRSVCYLAAGRPVITQETGFSKYISTGAGLFGFSTLDEAAAAVESIHSDYVRHSEAAREVAREFFSSERIIGDMARRIGLL